MEVKYERSCGLDVHKKSVVACVIVPGKDGVPEKERRSYGTTTEELSGLRDWLEGSRPSSPLLSTKGAEFIPAIPRAHVCPDPHPGAYLMIRTAEAIDQYLEQN